MRKLRGHVPAGTTVQAVSPLELESKIAEAFHDLAHWDAFTAEMTALGHFSIKRWLVSHASRVRSQIERRPPLPTASWSTTNGALEQKLRGVKTALDDRPGRLTNRNRLNRLFMLMLLHLNGADNELTYARTIRDELLSNRGLSAQRHRILDEKDK